ncbi:MAG: sigma-70 family RNA polymerase sigma factor [Lachnospiraceae bacterium]|nr:sigma-70 family RNA polymerase sigma factor [Lachnospiraceae bacterium]
MNLQSDRSHNGSLSFEEIYEQYYEKVFNFVYMRLLHREDAEDVTEDTFVKAMAAYESYNPEKASYMTWLCTIARNSMIDHIRKAHRDKIIPFDETFDKGEMDHELESLTDDTQKRVFEIFSHLRQEERELLSLRYGMELGYQDIAKLLGIEPKAAAKRVERLLKKCREIGGNDSV